MKTEFYYNKRKYACCIVKTNSLTELRIRNEEGEVLAVEQGKKIGLQGKKGKIPNKSMCLSLIFIT